MRLCANHMQIAYIVIQVSDQQTGSQANFGLLSVFGNKVLLGCCYTHSFTYHLWLLSDYKGSVE